MRTAFTIILNGLHHLKHNNFANFMCRNFDLWVIIEGAAYNTGSTSWCKPMPIEYHNNGRSIDGTFEYLIELEKQNPNIKVVSGYWKNKDEMVNKAIDIIKTYTQESWLWQVDVDEQWNIQDINEAEEILKTRGDIGFFRFNHFVGKNLIAVGEWGGNSVARLWKWSGQNFIAHEPPIMQGLGNRIELPQKYNHYAYYFEQDVKFKSLWYGEHEQVYENWKKLQGISEDKFPIGLDALFGKVKYGLGKSQIEIFNKKQIISNLSNPSIIKYKHEPKEQKEQKEPKINQIQKINGITGVTAVICTRNRYTTTLPITLLSLINQSKVPEEILIYDDNCPSEDLRKNEVYKYLFAMMEHKGIQWSVILGGGKGQVASHNHSIQKAKYNSIWRIDDDECPQPDCLKILFDEMQKDDKIGAIGGLIRNPLQPTSPLPSDVKHSIFDIKYSIQWFDIQKQEAEHLHSSFLYRRDAALHGYNKELSRIGHTEETLFTHEMKRNGWKLIIEPRAITWHLQAAGGIRSESDVEMWKTDEKIYWKKLKDWGYDRKEPLFCHLLCGLGDNYMFLQILPDLIKKYEKVEIATEFPFLFTNIPNVTILNTNQGREKAKELGKTEDDYHPYRWCIEQNWGGHFTEAMAQLYGLSGWKNSDALKIEDLKRK